MTQRIRLRRDTAATWTSVNPTLLLGEVGIETDTRKFKFGTGSTSWDSLPYVIDDAGASALDGLSDVTITAAATGDILRHNGTAWVDAPGSTHFEAAGAVTTHASSATAHTPAITQTALGTSYSPGQLTMRVVHAERSRNPLPADGPFVPFVDDFAGDTRFTNRWSITTASGTASAQTIVDNRLTVSATSGGALDRVYKAQTRLVSPAGVFTAVRVDPGWSGDSYACCGFFENATGDFVQAQWRLNTGALDITARSGGGQISISSSSGTADTLAGPTTDTGPLWLGMILSWNEAILVTSRDGVNWDHQVRKELSRTTSLNDSTAWDLFRPGMRLVPAASGTVVVSSFRCGYVGASGIRDMKPLTFEDGTPLKANGKYWIAATVAHGGNSFRSNHMAIWSFDPNTYQVELVRHLFYNLVGTGVGACYGGQAVYNETTATWTVLANSWGFDTLDSGVDLVLATTTEDLLSPGVSVLRATRITNISTTSVYDSSLRKENGTWYVAAIETASRLDWGSGYGPSLFSGPSLDNLTRVQATGTTETDGTCWAKIGGTWYILVGGSTGWAFYSSTMTGRTTLSSWMSNLPTSLFAFAEFQAHACLIPVDDGWRTRYCLLSFDAGRLLTGLSSIGGLVVLEADEKPTGQEFAPRLAPRYLGT